MGDRRVAYRHTEFWLGDPMERDHLKDLGIDGRIILKCIFKKWNVETCTGLIYFRIGTGGGCL
jgi:hypothetical protein